MSFLEVDSAKDKFVAELKRRLLCILQHCSMNKYTQILKPVIKYFKGKLFDKFGT